MLLLLGSPADESYQMIKAAYVQNEWLSDKLRDLSSKYPETKMLEHKLTKMVKLQPELDKSLHSLDKLTEFSNEPKTSSSFAHLAPPKLQKSKRKRLPDSSSGSESDEAHHKPDPSPKPEAASHARVEALPPSTPDVNSQILNQA